MYIIQPSLTTNWVNLDGYNKLLVNIDKKIACIANAKFFNIIYGLHAPVDLDIYEDLCDYKEILLDKLMGCNCLDDVFTIDIVSKIQKILNQN